MDTFNDLLGKIHGASTKAYDCIPLLQTAFTHNSSEPLKDCLGKLNSIKKTEAEATIRIAEMVRDDHTLKPYLSIPQLLLRIGEHIEKLVEIINKKIKEDVLFSDRGISEITFLLQRLAEILKTTSDLLLIRNPALIRHIQESESDLANKALEYATLHEERLIEGLCLPMASPLFLNMLNAIRNIAWDAKEIAIKFANH
jgi:hypothetical protein